MADDQPIQTTPAAADATVAPNATPAPAANTAPAPAAGAVSAPITSTAPASAVSPVSNDRPTAQTNKQPKSVDETLGKINRAFKERATVDQAKKLGMSYINVAVTPVNPDLLHIIPPEMARKAMMMPFFRIGKRLRVAIADPENVQTKAAIAELTASGYEVNLNLASDDAILEAMRLYETNQYKPKKALETSLSEEKIKAYEEEIKQLADLKTRISSVSSEEAIYLINVGALKTGASDIHYEPEEKNVRLRFRIDGVLHHIFDIEKTVYANLVNQIKYQCRMKLNINNEPQDGRYGFVVNDRKVDIRVSALPTEYGETFVCRLLDSGRHLVDFEELGFWDENLQKMQHLTQISHGMILITGPTGSGKTTTLYTMLEKFNAPENKVITLEDPIEYHLAGISQSQINEKRGYDFANGLRAILRQDPDVVMLGEIRDLSTAETAAQAALTGHVLLSTLHTNSAIETIPRLVNIGLPPFMIAPALNTIIAQRLVRKICPNCQKPAAIPAAGLEAMQRDIDSIKQVQPTREIIIPDQLPVAAGCDICNHTGYKGRICIVEMLNLDFEMKDLILNNASSIKIIEIARRKGMLTMREDGVLKVLKGITTLEEVHRVTAIAE